MVTTTLGLSEREVQARRASGQGNDVEQKTSRSYLQIFRENLFTFFNVVLLGLGLVLVWMGQPKEAFFTTGIAIVNLFIAVTQEVRAKKKLDQIALLARPKATVVRDGLEVQVDPSEVVLDDTLIVGPGDQVVVDGILIGDGQLDVDESMLTGEAEPVIKRPGDKIYSGSFCISGRGTYRAQLVGADSFINKLAAEARTYKREYTPLQRQINMVVRVLLLMIIFFGVLMTIGALLNDRSIVENARNASVLFGLAPSSLFLMIVVAYAMGAVRMADKGALVQQVNSVESLCHVTVICLDKTGTLTANRLKLDKIKILSDRLTMNELRDMLGDFARSASSGNRTSEAIVKSSTGVARDTLDEVPFSSDRKWSALAFEGSHHLNGAYVLGAPEVLRPQLSQNNNSHQQVIQDMDGHLQALTSQGLRVLLFARQADSTRLHDDYQRPRLPSDLTPLGLVSFADRLRPEARKTLEGFTKAGVEQKIISGDSPDTVLALTRQAHLFPDIDQIKVVSGPELAQMDEGQFAITARDTTIFGRITPEQKEKLVRSLRNQGQYVAMTGDGVNDVLALKEANLGIAMQSGSQATRSVADIVLLNDSFAPLPETMLEGQRILHGMQDVLKLYFTRILSLTLLFMAIAIIGVGFPFTPMQSALVSALTVSIPAFMLALWARPGPIHEGGLTRRLLHFVIPAVLSITIVGVGVYLYFLARSFSETGFLDVSIAQQALTFTVTLCGILIIVFVEPPTEFWEGGDELSGDWRPTLLAIGIFFIIVAMTSFRLFRDLYNLMVLQTSDFLTIGLVVILWAIGLRFAWRKRLLERYLSIDFDDVP